jgi:hypothetical protein
VLRPLDVVGPDGSRWTVGRKLLPWRPKRRIRGDSWDLPGVSFGDFGGDDPISFVLGIVAAVVLAVGLLVVLGPMLGVLVLGLEWLVVVLLAGAGVVARLVLGRPFVVYARGAAGEKVEHVAGWRASQRTMQEWAEQVRRLGHP